MNEEVFFLKKRDCYKVYGNTTIEHTNRDIRYIGKIFYEEGIQQFVFKPRLLLWFENIDLTMIAKKLQELNLLNK